jgi:peptide/nickel transport system permease protein
MNRESLRQLKREFFDRMKFTIREGKIIFYALKGSSLSLFGVIIVTFFVLVALLAPILAPPEPGQNPYISPYEGQNPYIYPLPSFPSLEHFFGTLDGYDIYYGCIWGTRTAFRTALLVIFVELVIGLSIGTVAGYFGGLVDELMMRLTDIFFAFPSILLAMIFIVALPAEWSMNLDSLSLSTTFSPLDKLAIATAIVGWPLYARLIRGEIIKVKSEDYVEAAKAIGCSNIRVVTRHILPNAIYPVLIMAFLDIGGITLSITTLSFLGFGPPEGYAEWGTMISNTRRFLFWSTTEPFKYIHTFLFPGLFLSTFVLGWSFIGDVLRNALDPMLRRE